MRVRKGGDEKKVQLPFFVPWHPPPLLPSRHTLLGRPSPAHLDLNLHARGEPIDGRDQTVDGEAPEIGVADTREVGGRNPGGAMSPAHAQAFPVERLDDLGGQDCFTLL